MTRVARVLLDSPLPQLDRLFDYAVPAALDEDAQPGVRIKVPLRSAGRLVDAYVIERVEAEESERPLSEIDSVTSPVSVLTPQLYALARRAADRAAGSASDILRLAIPKRMVRAEKAWQAAEEPERPTVAAEDVRWAEDVLSPYRSLPGLVDDAARIAVDAPPRPAASGDGPAWAELVAAVAVRELAAGSSAIIVVPDYRDREHVQAVLRAHAPADTVIRGDADQSGPERYRNYLRTLSAAPCIVVGNRSSVYSPVHDLGVVIVWDDGDSLLAEPLSPGVHARDAALIRQEREGHALVFAGHTRTTDVERLVGLGWVADAPAKRRESPAVKLDATREGEAQGIRVTSAAFAAAREAVKHGPVLVQVSRPGYAPVVVCASCRTPARCTRCAGPLRVTSHGRLPECAACGRAARGWTCRSCHGDTFRLASSGSERTADELGRAFPGVRVIVADKDHPVTHVSDAPALVVATRGAEPFAQGGYRAVILLDGDRMLLTEQLRIGESCLRWWSNAAALAAPGAPVHLIGVTGPVARALATWTQPAYARAELAERAPLRMPPAVRVATLEGTGAAVSKTLDAVREAVPSLADGGSIIGPVTGAEETRALVRFDYASGAVVAQTLRAEVVSAALRGRRGRGAPRTTLRVRLDVPELDLEEKR